MFDIRLYGQADEKSLALIMMVEGGRLREWHDAKVVLLDKRARNPDSPVLVFLTPENVTKTFLRGEIRSLSDRRRTKIRKEDMPMLRKNLLQVW